MSVLPCSLSPTERRRVDAFAGLLEDSRGAEGHELEPLVALATTLRPARVFPRADFRAALRERLVAEGSARTPAVPAQRAIAVAPPRHRVRRLVVTGVTVGLVSGAAAAAASTRALPGDSLYPVKRGLESIELRMAHSDLTRGRELFEQADHRLSEAETMAASADSRSTVTTRLIAAALADMDTGARSGAAALDTSYAETGDNEALVLLDRFVVDQQRRLDDLVALLDPSLRPQVAGLSDLLARMRTKVEAVLTSTRSPTSARPTGATDTALVALGAARDSGDGWAVSQLSNHLATIAPTGQATDDGGSGGNPSASGDLAGDVGSRLGAAVGGLTGSGAAGGTSSGTGSTGGSSGTSSGGGLVGGGAGTTSAPALPPAPAPPVPVPSISVPRAPLPPVSVPRAPLPPVSVPRASSPVSVPRAPLPLPSVPLPAPPSPVVSAPVDLPVSAPAVTCVPTPLTPC